MDPPEVAPWTPLQHTEYSSASMWAGDVLAERFVLERQIGGGGMGTVFRALDRATGTPVAVKAIDVISDGAVERFRREARVLSEMSHPGIVRYIAHGESDDGEPFLVMEWLEGEDLSRSLARGGLSADASLAVVRRAAEALSFAHSQGVVHRDIKPSNLFLVGGDSERVKVLDFGIAKPRSPSRELTGASTLLGTFGYMAPEQVTGSALVDTRADVFSLGCVLFECLTGRPAFAAEHAVAVLAKLLAADVPKPSSLRPELGCAIDDLLSRMLAKEPDARLRDARAVVEAIAEIGAVAEAQAPTVDRQGARITDSERKGVTVILAESGSMELGRTATPTQMDADVARIRELAGRFGAEVQLLHGGALLVVVAAGPTAVDQATHAASLALQLGNIVTDAWIAIATGLTDADGPVPIGPVIDRAAALLSTLTSRGDASTGKIAVDTLAADLLVRRFVVSTKDNIHVLDGERVDLDTPHVLLGKPTPCVGREKELALLDATLREVMEDSVARAVLVTAPPGTGKSRLLAEFLARVRSSDGPRALVARADAVAPGSPLSLVRQIVRRAASLVDSDQETIQRRRLKQYVSELGQPSSTEAPVEFIRELAGIPREGALPPLLVAAHNDPAIMREQKRRAFDWWLEAHLAAGALVVVLEDLHWGDTATLNYFDWGMRKRPDRQLMVLASARPEVHEVFPKLLPEMQEIHLTGLAPRAAERLVRAVLGTGTDDEAVARIVRRADGNAFYLEELIRRAAEGDDSLPETVIAMVQSRLARLEPQARRVLRAASVFGDTCWAGGVIALVGASVDAAGWLEVLADRELLLRRAESRFPRECEFAFRHNLLREAAYATLTEEDRAAAHLAAGDWLEKAGENDSRNLADHFERGGDKTRAIPWIVHAAQAAADALAFETSLSLSRRGLDLGATGEDRGALLALHAAATGFVVAEYDAAWNLAQEALALLPGGSPRWWQALAHLIWCTITTGRSHDMSPYVDLAMAAAPAEPSGRNGLVIFGMLSGLPWTGQVELARSFLERLDRSGLSERATDPTFDAWLNTARCHVGLNMPYTNYWRLESALRWGEESTRVMAEVGSVFGEANATFTCGLAHMAIGNYDEANAAFERAALLASRTDVPMLREWVDLFKGQLHALRGHPNEALVLLEPLRTSRHGAVRQFLLCVSADVHNRTGNFEQALKDAGLAADCALVSARRWGALEVAYALFSLGRFEEALSATDRALREPVQLSADGEGALLTFRASALYAVGRVDEARSTIREARDLIMRVADRFENAELRQSFLTSIDVNRTIFSLAKDWLGEAQA